MRTQTPLIFSLLAAAVLPSLTKAELTATNSVQEQLSAGPESSPTSNSYSGGSNTISVGPDMASAYGYSSGAFGYAQSLGDLYDSAIETSEADAFVADIIYFKINGPTSQVDLHLFGAGIAYAETTNPATGYGQAFVALGFGSNAYYDPTETLSKLNIFRTGSLSGAPDTYSSSDTFSVDQDFVADTNTLYFIYLLSSSSGSVTGTTDSGGLYTFSDIFAGFYISDNVPNSSQYTITLSPGTPLGAPVPEPSTYGLLGGVALAALAFSRKLKLGFRR